VERIQGSEGVVNVQWRLNAEAVYDFYEPHTGSLLFAQVHIAFAGSSVGKKGLNNMFFSIEFRS